MTSIQRYHGNPIIHSALKGLAKDVGDNINGPSLIRCPDWLENPLGKYYLYFAHHKGLFIRLAYADDIRGPWRIHESGTLHLNETVCSNHIASPDVHVDRNKKRIIMYFHGPLQDRNLQYPRVPQKSFYALSENGICFKAAETVLGPPYFRVFEHENVWYSVSMDSSGPRLGRSDCGFGLFKPGPIIGHPKTRHTAILKRGNTLHLIYSCGQDLPERIMTASMELKGDWRNWKLGAEKTLIVPERDYEGGNLAWERSEFGVVWGHVPQLRDPCVFEEDGQTYLIYSAAGESSLALATLTI